MKKVKMLISFLLFLFFTYGQVKAVCPPKAQDIPVYKKGPHMGTRTTEACVNVSLDDGDIIVNISKYVGDVKVAIVGKTGCVVTNRTFFIEGNGSERIGLPESKNVFYTITIMLDNVVYTGIIDI